MNGTAGVTAYYGWVCNLIFVSIEPTEECISYSCGSGKISVSVVTRNIFICYIGNISYSSCFIVNSDVLYCNLITNIIGIKSQCDICGVWTCCKSEVNISTWYITCFRNVISTFSACTGCGVRCCSSFSCHTRIQCVNIYIISTWNKLVSSYVCRDNVSFAGFNSHRIAKSCVSVTGSWSNSHSVFCSVINSKSSCYKEFIKIEQVVKYNSTSCKLILSIVECWCIFTLACGVTESISCFLKCWLVCIPWCCCVIVSVYWCTLENSLTESRLVCHFNIHLDKINTICRFLNCTQCTFV